MGVDVPEAIECFADVARRIDIAPNEVWVCCGSGTLIRGLQKDWNLRKVKKMITIYNKDNCVWCVRAKTLLQMHNIEFNIAPLDDLAIEFIQTQTGHTVKSAPQILNFTKDKKVVYIGGFVELKEQIEKGELV